MPHCLDENIAVLRRWAAISDEPLPEDWGKFASKNLDLAVRVDQQDPELAMLLSGKAPASLKADALAGKLSHQAPDQAALKEEQFNQQLATSRERVKAGEASLTERIWLEVNDPQAKPAEAQMPNFTGPLAEAQRDLWMSNQRQMAATGGQG